MTIAEYAVLSVLIAAVVVSLGLAFSASFDSFPHACAPGARYDDEAD